MHLTVQLINVLIKRPVQTRNGCSPLPGRIETLNPLYAYVEHSSCMPPPCAVVSACQYMRKRTDWMVQKVIECEKRAKMGITQNNNICKFNNELQQSHFMQINKYICYSWWMVLLGGWCGAQGCLYCCLIFVS